MTNYGSLSSKEASASFFCLSGIQVIQVIQASFLKFKINSVAFWAKEEALKIAFLSSFSTLIQDLT